MKVSNILTFKDEIRKLKLMSGQRHDSARKRYKIGLKGVLTCAHLNLTILKKFAKQSLEKYVVEYARTYSSKKQFHFFSSNLIVESVTHTTTCGAVYISLQDHGQFRNFISKGIFICITWERVFADESFGQTEEKGVVWFELMNIKRYLVCRSFASSLSKNNEFIRSIQRLICDCAQF